MTAPRSPVDVCNLALLQIAARAQITSIDPSDGTVAGDACAALYQPTVDAFARAAHWNCLRFTATLSLLAAAAGTPENPSGTTLRTPPPPWLYEYALPDDCLKARFIVPAIPQQGGSPMLGGATAYLPSGLPDTAVPFVVAVDLDAGGNEIAVILANIGAAAGGPPSLVYTRRLNNIGLWDSHFLMGAKSALAAWLVNPINASAAMMTQAVGLAKAMLDAARISDGNEGPSNTEHVPDWIAIRSGGRIRPAGMFVAPYDAFSFPNGVSY